MTFPIAKALEPVRVDRIDPLSSSVDLDAWRDLARVAADPNPFFGPDFLVPFLTNMPGPKVELAVAAEEHTGRWLMAAPVAAARPGLALQAATIWASEYAPLGTLLLHPDANEKIACAFVQEAMGESSTLAIPYLPLSTRIAALLSYCQERGPRFAKITDRAAHDGGEAGKDQFNEAFSGKRRKEYRRLLRRLGEESGLGATFDSLSGPGTVEAFEQFLQLEATGWKGDAGTALISRSDTCRFSREAVRNRAQRHGVRIDRLLAGGTPIAMLVSFIEGNRAFAWKIAYDERYARYSPGAQITVYAITQNLETPGLDGADSLAIPGHKMIEPLWRGRMTTGTMLISAGRFAKLHTRLVALDIAVEERLRKAAKAMLKQE